MKKILLSIGTAAVVVSPVVATISCSTEKPLPILKSDAFGYVFNNPEKTAELILKNPNSGLEHAVSLNINEITQNELSNSSTPIFENTFVLKKGEPNAIILASDLKEEFKVVNSRLGVTLDAFAHTKGIPLSTYTNYLRYRLIINKDNQTVTFQLFEIAKRIDELTAFADSFMGLLEKRDVPIDAGYQFFKGVAIFTYDKFVARYHVDNNFANKTDFENKVTEITDGKVAPVPTHIGAPIVGTNTYLFGPHSDISIIMHPLLDISNKMFSVELEFNKGGRLEIGTPNDRLNNPTADPYFASFEIPDAFPSNDVETSKNISYSSVKDDFAQAVKNTQQWIADNSSRLPSFADAEPSLASYVDQIEPYMPKFNSTLALDVSDNGFVERAFNNVINSDFISIDAFLELSHGVCRNILNASPSELQNVLEAVMFVYVNMDLIDEFSTN